MTYAPADLLAVQRYAHDRTGMPWDALGIIHGTPQGGGYHEGHDLLHAAGRAPEDPGSDYSYTESPRDRSGLTDAGSAFDLGGAFGRFREITMGIVHACERGDPRTRDIREVIYTPDGQVVRRWDRLGRRSSGDSSHLSHTHISFFRDAEGRRAAGDNFLGLLRELFEGDAVGINELAYNADANAWAVRMGVDSQVYPGDNPGPLAHAGNPLWDLLRRLDTNVAADLAEDKATTAALKALVDQVNAAGGSVDAAPILAAIAAARDEESAAVAALHDQVADLTHKLAAAEQAAAAALTQA